MSLAVSDFGPIVDTTTKDGLIPKVADNVLYKSPLLMRFLKRRQAAQAWGEVTGKSVIFPIKYQKSTQGGWYSGFDTFATNQSNTRVLAQLYPKQLYWSVGASGIQIAVNKGPDGVLDFLSTEMSSVADDMADTLCDGLYSAGTGTSNKEITGLQAAVNDGSDTATYAGLARGTYTTWVSYEDDDSEAINRADLAALFDGAQTGSEKPTIIVTTPAIWTTLEGLAMGTISFNNPMSGLSREYGTMTDAGVSRGQTGELGFTTLFFRGVPVVADEKCTSGRIYLLNENHIGMAFWPYPDFPGYVTKSEYNGFCWTGLKMPTNQDASVGQLLFYGQLVTDACRTHSYAYNKS